MNKLTKNQFKYSPVWKSKLACIVLLLLTVDCRSQEIQQDTNHNVSRGIVRQGIDSALLNSIQQVQFDSSIGIIFSAEYAKQIVSGMEVETFTPSPSLIKTLDTFIINHYCNAFKRFNNIAEVGETRKDRKERLAWVKDFDLDCRKTVQNIKHYDKQFIGYVLQPGDTIILINLCDFRQDSNNIKSSYLFTTWMIGSHGWFESHTELLHFHLKTCTLTINEDI